MQRFTNWIMKVLIILLSFATFGCGEESQETEQSNTVTSTPAEPRQEALEQQLVARAQEAVRESGIDPCEEDVVYMVCRWPLGESVVKTSHSEPCTDGDLICPGPRPCKVGFTYHPYLDLDNVAESWDTTRRGYSWTHIEAGGISHLPYTADHVRVLPTEPQGHCMDPDAVLIQCPENSELDELIYPEDVWTVVPCPGLTLVCPQGKDCSITGLSYETRLVYYTLPEAVSFPITMPFGNGNENYRIPMTPENLETLQVIEVANESGRIHATVWRSWKSILPH